MKTTTIKLYEYSELAEEAKKKALDAWNENSDMPFLPSMLQDECGQLLKAHDIKCLSNHPKCLYSLSYCQGDGLMFEGKFEWKDYYAIIKHDGRYYHSNSKTYELVDAEGVEAPQASCDAFEAIYQDICKKLEKLGYELIAEETSEAHFIDECNANEWTFEANGVMRNA